MKETKTNILSGTLRLFNERGFVNVRLQQIADEVNISIGNLAYHYATKKDLLFNIYKDIVIRQSELLNDLNIVPLFENMDRHWDNVFETQIKYAFFYQDTLEVIRFNESIAIEYRNHIQWEKDQFQRLIQFNIARGALITMNQSTVEKTADLLWLMENSWLQRAVISGNEPLKIDDFKSHMWQGFVPYFSHTGKQEYDQLIKNKSIPL
ncbi:MAG: TetR/AcrR family transcriptional regulator [Bacteroidota bacterium]